MTVTQDGISMTVEARWDAPTQRWASIPPACQEEMVVLYEKWLRSEEYAADADLRQRVHADIAADAVDNSISPAQAAYLRDVWSDVTGGVR